MHEAGHALHVLAVQEEDLLAYRATKPKEFREVASMSIGIAGH